MTNAEWVLSTYSRTAGGDTEFVTSRFRPDVTIEAWSVPRSNQVAGVPWRQTRHGLDGAAQYLHDLLTWIGVERIEPLNALEGGNQVAIPMRVHAKSLATGQPIVMEAITLWTFDDEDRVVSVTHHTDTHKEIELYHEALAARGVSEN